jgi:hypothetical protein
VILKATSILGEHKGDKRMTALGHLVGTIQIVIILHGKLHSTRHELLPLSQFLPKLKIFFKKKKKKNLNLLYQSFNIF